MRRNVPETDCTVPNWVALFNSNDCHTPSASVLCFPILLPFVLDQHAYGQELSTRVVRINTAIAWVCYYRPFLDVGHSFLQRCDAVHWSPGRTSGLQKSAAATIAKSSLRDCEPGLTCMEYLWNSRAANRNSVYITVSFIALMIHSIPSWCECLRYHWTKWNGSWHTSNSAVVQQLFWGSWVSHE